MLEIIYAECNDTTTSYLLCRALTRICRRTFNGISAHVCLHRLLCVGSNYLCLQGHSGASRKNFTCSRCHAQFSRRSCFHPPAHCNRTDIFAATSTNDMVIAVVGQGVHLQPGSLSRRCPGSPCRVCRPPRQWRAYHRQ